MYKCISVLRGSEKARFLTLPGKLYRGDVCPQNYDEEELLLDGIHPLSNDFLFFPYIVFDKFQKTICRCAVTYYPNDNVAYLGFFEAYENEEAVKVMFEAVERDARKRGITKIIGPVNASIFIGYRFKVDNFDRVYTGEPYNKPYYKELWEKFGFAVSDTYVSNFLRKVTEKDNDELLQRIYNRYERKGYKVVNPTKRTFKKCLTDIYALMMDLYSGFSGYKMISQKQFLKMYSYLKYILKYDMVHLVYHNEKLMAFSVAVPNYGKTSIGDTSLLDKIKILNMKKNPKEYVILYVGADQSTPGLGGALMHVVKNKLLENKCTSIGALIKEGNITGRYYDSLYVSKTHYELFEKSLN